MLEVSPELLSLVQEKRSNPALTEIDLRIREIRTNIDVQVRLNSLVFLPPSSLDHVQWLVEPKNWPDSATNRLEVILLLPGRDPEMMERQVRPLATLARRFRDDPIVLSCLVRTSGSGKSRKKSALSDSNMRLGVIPSDSPLLKDLPDFAQSLFLIVSRNKVVDAGVVANSLPAIVERTLRTRPVETKEESPSD